MIGKRKPGCRERHFYPNYEEEECEEAHAKINDDWIRVETINVTHLDHNKLVLLRRKRSTIIVIQEHKLKEHEIEGMKEAFRLAG